MITVISATGEIVEISGFHAGKQIRKTLVPMKLQSKELQHCVRER